MFGLNLRRKSTRSVSGTKPARVVAVAAPVTHAEATEVCGILSRHHVPYVVFHDHGIWVAVKPEAFAKARTAIRSEHTSPTMVTVAD